MQGAVMSLELISKKTDVDKAYVIMFSELSEEAQQKALACVGVESEAEKHWDILPIAYTHMGMSLTTQEDIDMEVLSQIGFY